MEYGTMKYVVWQNRDLAEPICIDTEGNAMEEYDPTAEEEGRIPDCEVIIYENGYGYLILDGEVQDGCCLEDQRIQDYIDEKHHLC